VTPATTRRRPLQARSAATVEAILEAAAQVFERHGYAAGTTNRIAERAGVSIGSLYQYFADKDAILVALTERHLDEGIAALAPLLAELVVRPPPVRAALERLMSALIELHRHRPGLHRILFEEAPRPPALRERLAAVADDATDALAGYLAQSPDAVVGDPRLAAHLVVTVLESVTHGLVIHPRDDVPPDAYAAQAVTMLALYLTDDG